jgi:hypothetical protein
MVRTVLYHKDHPTPPDAPRRSMASAAYPPEILNGPKVRMPDFDRSYLLFEGPIDAAGELGGWVDWGGEREFIQQQPSLWWADDHAWCVATEIDFEFTHVGGSRELIDNLLALPELEVQRTTLTAGDDPATSH